MQAVLSFLVLMVAFKCIAASLLKKVDIIFFLTI
jgi:hypothetical protein